MNQPIGISTLLFLICFRSLVKIIYIKIQHSRVLSWSVLFFLEKDFKGFSHCTMPSALNLLCPSLIKTIQDVKVAARLNKQLTQGY